VELQNGAFKALLPKAHRDSDTRVKIIDVILQDVLGWPEALIEREPHVRETGGYIDYVLSTSHLSATVGHGIELCGNAESGRLQVQAVNFELAGAVRDRQRDIDIETSWCAEIE
jgi:hypothetical protein